MVEFRDRSFCFTGKLANMKRSQTQREARARGALTINTVNERLDYLVIGSIPATGWKYGSYGTKIETARALRAARRKPKLVPEAVFLDALCLTPTTDSGEIDEKVFVGTYKFTAPDLMSFDIQAAEACLVRLQGAGCHVRVDVTESFVGTDLFEWVDKRTGEVGGAEVVADDGYIVVEARILSRLPLEVGGQQIADNIEVMFEQVRGVDGTLTWFERAEGTAGFARLLSEIGQRTLVEVRA